MVTAVCRAIDGSKETLTRLQQGMRYVSPSAQLARHRDSLEQKCVTMNRIVADSAAAASRRTDEAERSMRDCMRNTLLQYRNRLGVSAAGLSAMSPYRLLQQGYAFITVDGKPVKQVRELQPGMRMQGYLADGAFTAEVLTTQQNDTED